MLWHPPVPLPSTLLYQNLAGDLPDKKIEKNNAEQGQTYAKEINVATFQPTHLEKQRLTV